MTIGLIAPDFDNHLTVDFYGNDPHVSGGALARVEGDSYEYSIAYLGATSITSPSAKIYRIGDETDLTADMLTGSAAANSNTVTTPVVHGLLGGETYVLAVTATIDGITLVTLIELRCGFPWKEARTTRNNPFVVGSKVERINGDSTTYTITFPGATTITSPTNKIYQKNAESDLSSTMLTGAASTSVNTVTTSVVHALNGGESYILAVTAVVDGDTRVTLIELRCGFPWKG